MVPREYHHNLHLRYGIKELQDGLLQNRATPEIKKLLGPFGAHSGAAAAGHENSINIFFHKYRFYAKLKTKLIIFVGIQ